MSDELATRARAILTAGPGTDDGSLPSPLRRAVPLLVVEPEVAELINGMVQVVARQVKHYLDKAFLTPEEVTALGKMSEVLIKLRREDRDSRKDAGQYSKEELAKIVQEALR